MFAVSASRTMASAKPKFKEPEPVRTMAQVRAEKIAEIREQARLAAAAQVEERRKLLEDRRREMSEQMTVALAAYRGRQRSYRHSYKRIEARICKALKVSRKEIESDRRTKDLVFARQAIMYWATRLTTLSLPQIGKQMGRRDHTTVLHGKNVYPAKRKKMGRWLRPAR